jgi:cytochrome b6-f complex iron-sulfur subunit
MGGRRDFVKCAAAAALGCAGCGGGGSVSGPLAPPDAQARVLRVALPSVGQTVALFDGDESYAVTRMSETSVVAVSRTCTHQGCTVLLPSGQPTLDCPCHGSRYTLTGAVVNGPAVRPLPSYAARIEGSQVAVTIG